MKTSNNSKPKLIVIVGPTAVGKTECSIRLAKKINGEIISADSRLFYRGMDIGTAKPTKKEMDDVVHHLIDVAEPDDVWSLAQFQNEAIRIATDISQRGKVPILVGGTGQYIRAVTEGWTPPEVIPNEFLRLTLENIAVEKGTQWLHNRLAILDQEAANFIDHRNVRRTIRAIEVIFQTGRKFSEQRGIGEAPFDCLFIGLIRSRTSLYERIDARIDKMFADGLLEEAKALLAKGYQPDLPSLSAIGYREAIAVVTGKMTQDEAVTEMKRTTRAFVRRQANWFKPVDPNIHWFDLDQKNATEIDTLLMTLIGSYL